MALNGNWVDLIIICVFVYFLSGAFRFGFFKLIGDSLSFLLSLFISLKIYRYASEFLKLNFNLNKSIADALGFMTVTILLETFIGILIYIFIDKLPKKIKDSKIDKILGIIPASIEGLLFIAFILSLFVSFPIRPNIKKDILDSKIGGVVIEKTSGIEKYVNNIFGGVIEDSLTYLAIEPGAKEKVDLKVTIDKLSVDGISEAKMFEMVNDERSKRGIVKLTWDSTIVPVARDYATDMWKRSYFSHYSPEGKDVGDRLTAAKIKYRVAGENLALAPTLNIAHNGLMNSEGHRENILSPDFKKIGIGVIDNGVYGKIFVQIFTD